MAGKNWFRLKQKKNDFLVRINQKSWMNDWIDLFQKQICSVDIDLCNKTIIIDVYQTTSGIIQDLIFFILKEENRTISEIRLKPARGSKYEYMFYNAKIIKHQANFSYFDDNNLIHRLTFKSDSVTLYSSTLKQENVINFND